MKLGLILPLFLLIGCLSEQQITPSFEPEPVKPITLKIPIDTIQVEDQFEEIGDVDVVGPFFRELAEGIANIELSEDGETEIVVDPCYYSIDDLGDIDFSYISEVQLQKVNLLLDEKQKDDEETSFSFLKSAEIYLKFHTEDELEELQNTTASCSDETSEDIKEDSEGDIAVNEAGDTPNSSDSEPHEDTTDVATTTGGDEPDVEIDLGSGEGQSPSANSDENGESTEEQDEVNVFEDAKLVLSFDKSQQNLGCDGKCIDMAIHQKQWREKLMKYRYFTIISKVQLENAPKGKFSFGGEIDVLVNINLDRQ